MFGIKLERPCRGIVLVVVGMIVLVGACIYGITKVRAVNGLISRAGAESAALGEQIRDNAVIFGVYRNASPRTGRSRKLMEQAESVQRKLWILRGERKKLIDTVGEIGGIERLLVRKDIEGALDFCDEQIAEYQSDLDDLFRRLSVSRPKFAGLRNRRTGRIQFFRAGIRRRPPNWPRARS
ncbi:MAG: hypothetical protein ACYS8Z_03655 [Planctomycetota bacterium]|jgi:hypothetical protein